MDTMEKRRKGPGGGGGGPVKNPRRKNKNGMKIKEEKMNQVGPDPGGGSRQNSVNNMQDLGDGSQSVPTPSKGLQDDLLLNGSEIKLENPSTPQLLDSKGDCNSDMTPLPDLGHPDFPDCKPMNPYCYPHYNNMPPGNSSMSPHPGGPHPGDYGHGPPHGPPSMGGYPPPPSQGPPTSTKQQPSTLEAQYMQQQSQIFVFSTQLANNAAEAVCQRNFPSIIAFHTSHPATRKFLECQVSPNWPPPPPPSGKMGKGSKGSQQSQPQQHMSIPGGPPNMPPDFNMHPGHPPSQGHPSQGGHPPQGHPNQGHPSQGHPPQGHLPPGHPSQGHPPQGHPNQGHPPPGPWNTHNPSPKQPQHGYPSYYDGPYCGGGMGPSGPGPMGPMVPGLQPPHSMCGPLGNSPGCPPGRLTGVKIRDEDLTPEQRHHREEQLAKMRKMQQMLFPEHDHMGDPNCQPMPPHENLDGYNIPPGGPPPGSMNMDYMQGPGGPGNKTSPNDWSSQQGGFFMDGQPGPGMKTSGGGPGPLPGMGSSGNGPRKVGGGSIPSPATPLTPGSSCGAPHRPSPHSPMSSGGDPLFPGGGHSFYPSGYYSPQVGQPQDNSPSAAVQRKDSESSNSEGGKSRKEKSSCSISPTSSAPPSVKEANLMPVPSPQQILYMNVFEGQELTIQKQPNVGLNDHTNDNSPGMPPSSLEMNPSTPIVNQQQKSSLSAPPTPVSISSSNNQKSTPEMVMTSNSSNSKTRPGSVGPVATPKSSTTPNPSPQGLDRSSQPGTPLQMNLGDMKSNNYGPPGNLNLGPGGPQPSCNMMKQMPLSLEYPDGPVGSVDNIPLNPDLAGPGPPGAKQVFDPISSMVQMSQSLTGGNGTPPNPPGSGMNSNGGYGMNPPGGPPMNPNMVNFNTSMHNVQNVDGGLVMGGPQTVNNTYVNATMTIQQMNIQNIPPYMNQNMNPHQMPGSMAQQMGPIPGGGPMSSMSSPQLGPPPNMQNHPSNINQMGPGGSGPMGMMSHQQMSMNQHQQMSSMGMCGMSRGGGPPHPQMMYGNQPRMPGQGVRGSPYRLPGNPSDLRAFGGTNIQVKPNAPNTIQYLPARPPPPHNQSQGPLCPQSGGMGPGPGGSSRQGPNLDFLQRYTNPSPGPVVNVNMGMNVNVNMSGNRMPYPGPPPMSGMGNNGPPPSMMRGQHSMMDQQGPGPSGPGGPLPSPMVGMKGPGGYGGPPGSGPPQQPNDNQTYAQQSSFHHFQQQLYATGTNNGRNPMQPNVQGNPNTPPNQSFFK